MIEIQRFCLLIYFTLFDAVNLTSLFIVSGCLISACQLCSTSESPSSSWCLYCIYTPLLFSYRSFIFHLLAAYVDAVLGVPCTEVSKWCCD